MRLIPKLACREIDNRAFSTDRLAQSTPWYSWSFLIFPMLQLATEFRVERGHTNRLLPYRAQDWTHHRPVNYDFWLEILANPPAETARQGWNYSRWENMQKTWNQRAKGRRRIISVTTEYDKLHRRRSTFSERLINRVCQIDGPVLGVIIDTLKELSVETILLVIEDELFVEGNRRIEFLLQVQISWFWEHSRFNSILLHKLPTLSLRIFQQVINQILCVYLMLKSMIAKQSSIYI